MIFPVCKIVGYDDGKPIFYKEGFCDSHETKPTGDDAADISDGSWLEESDTGDVYQYSAVGDAWNKHFSVHE